MTETGGAMGNGLYREGLLGSAALRLRSCKLQATSYKPQAKSQKRNGDEPSGALRSLCLWKKPRDVPSRGFSCSLKLGACSCRPKAGRSEVRFCVFSQCRARYALQVDVYAVGKVFEAFGQIGQA